MFLGDGHTVVSVLKSGDVQVWNMAMLESAVDNSFQLFDNGVSGIHAAGSRAICTGRGHPEARVVDLDLAQWEMNLRHGSTLQRASLSAHGGLALTFGLNDPAWPWLNEVWLWDLVGPQLLQQMEHVKHVTFTTDESRAIFAQLVRYEGDLDHQIYRLVTVDVDGAEVDIDELPSGDIVTPLVVCCKERAVAMLLQSAKDYDVNDAVVREYRVTLQALSLIGRWRGMRKRSLAQLCPSANEEDLMLDLRGVGEHNVLVIYGKSLAFIAHDEEGNITRNQPCSKAAILYNLHDDVLLRCYEEILSPTTDVTSLQMSANVCNALSNDLDIYDIIGPGHMTRLKEDLQHCVLVLDGRYVAGLSAEGDELVLSRSSDGVCKGRVFIHDIGTCISKGCDDRSLLVGTEDGRLMGFTVVLEHPDPRRDVIDKLPSRRQTANDGDVMATDRRNIRMRSSDYRSMSARTRRKTFRERARPTSVRLLERTSETMRSGEVTSAACVIQ